MTQSSVRDAVREYHARRPALVQATDAWTTVLTAALDDAGINYLVVDGRTKSVASFAEKASRVADGSLLYPDPLTQITDQIGVRIITYVRDDVNAVAELLGQEFTILDDRDLGQETASQGRWGYGSRHLLVAVDASKTLPRAQRDLRTHTVSVQVRTVLQHAWAEFEHDIRYKGSVPAEHEPDLNRRFTLAAGLLELADQEFSAIRDRLRVTTPPPSLPTLPGPEDGIDGPGVGAGELAAFLAGRYPDAGWSRTAHYGWISGLLAELGITALDRLATVLAGVDSDALTAQMGYRYPPAAVRRLDDALLATYGERYISLHGNEHRTEQLRDRASRMNPTAGS